MTAPKHNKAKIPLPDWWNKSNVPVVEGCLSKYWHLSQVWNDRVPSAINIQEAITSLRELGESLGPQRLIARKAEELKNDIITFGTKRAKIRCIKNSKHIAEVETPAKVFII